MVINNLREHKKLTFYWSLFTWGSYYPYLTYQVFIYKITANLMKLLPDEESRIIEMAWEDRTPFEAIEHQFNMQETEIIKFMRYNLKPRSFKLWRQRVSGRSTKHLKLRSKDVLRGYCPTQYKNR